MRRILSVVILSILLVANFDVPTAFGCVINLGDPWYKVDAQVVNNPLSDVLGISFSRNGGEVTFTNLGLKSNLYIASKDIDGLYPGYRESQRNHRPYEKYIGKDYDPNVIISIDEDFPQKGIFSFYNGWHETRISDEDDLNTGTLSLARALDSTDNYKTKQVTGDGRPDDVPIPDPDYQTMYAFYDGSQYNIDIILSYSINDSYSPDRSSKSCEGEYEAFRTAGERRQSEASAVKLLSFVFLAGLMIVASLSVVLALKSAKSKKAKTSKRRRTAKPKTNRTRKK